MPSRYGGYCAALGGLAVGTAALAQVPAKIGEAGEASAQRQGSPPAASSVEAGKPVQDTGASREGSPNAYEREALALDRAANRIAEKANRIAQHQAGLNFWQIVLNIAVMAFTGWAAVAAGRAARSAQQAVDVIPILEAAYPFVVIERDDVKHILGHIQEPGYFPDPRASVWFLVKNYGSTPATIVSIVAHLRIVSKQPRASSVEENFITYETMLGQGDKTHVFEAKTPNIITVADFFDIHNGSAAVHFSGWVQYLDVWDRAYTLNFGWKWNPTLQQFDLVHQARGHATKDKHPRLHRMKTFIDGWPRRSTQPKP